MVKFPDWLSRHITRRQMFVKYAVIGVTGIVIDTLIFALLVYMLHMNPVLATIISTTCGITNNFFWNVGYNFKTKDRLWQRFFNFYSVGLAGIAASALIVLLFADIFALDAFVVKMVSLPPIVLGQYFLNRQFSFGEKQLSWRRVATWISKYRYLLLIQAIFVLLCLPMVRYATLTNVYTASPDETQHYGKNVKFMLDNHRLAVSGRDDIDSLSNCRDNKYGPLPCLYSYQFTPPFNYIVSTVTAKIGQSVGLSPLTGARLASVMWGVVFITFAYLIARLYLKKSLALVATATVAFIPQIIFVSTYVNQDIHSLALGTIMMFATLSYLVFGNKKLRWLFYVSFGFLFLAKYNYFATAIIPAALLAWRWWRGRNTRELLIDVAWLAGAAIIIAVPWFIRNLILYHDLLGMSYSMQQMTQYHALGHKWPLSDINSWMLMFRTDIYAQRDAFTALFQSFFATFGYMNVRLDESFYTLIKVALLAGVALAIRYGTRAARVMLLCMAGFIGIWVMQVILNSYTYDFSFQGRYLFAILPLLFAGSVFILNQIGRRKPELANSMGVAGLVVVILVLLQSILVELSNFVGQA